jgi:hypothetical protein
MSIKIKKVTLKPMEMGNIRDRRALGYFRKFSLSSKAENPNTLLELILGLSIQVDLNSLEIPDNENSWLWYDSSTGKDNPISKAQKDAIIDIYKNYLNFELNLSNPEIDDRNNVVFNQKNGNAIILGFGKNPGEDDPLMIWATIDIRELDVIGEQKELEWRNYELDVDGKPLGIEQRWEYEYMKPTADHDEVHSGMQNVCSWYLPGYSVSISFECQVEGEIKE